MKLSKFLANLGVRSKSRTQIVIFLGWLMAKGAQNSEKLCKHAPARVQPEKKPTAGRYDGSSQPECPL
jgi:16S rRNA U516 pseudouridylate synthase RsuA-like enzyme